jgi:DNA mismatch repair protein MLH1
MSVASFQDLVIDAICRQLEATLLAAMSSRTFATHSTPATTALRLAEQLVSGGGSGSGNGGSRQSAQQTQGQASTQQQQQQQQQQAQQQMQKPKQTQQQTIYRPDKLVRADHRTRTMDAFVVRGASAPAVNGGSKTGQQGGGGGGGGEADVDAVDAEADASAGLAGHTASAAAKAAVAVGMPRKRRAAERDRLAFNSSMAAAVVGSGDDGEERQDGVDGHPDAAENSTAGALVQQAQQLLPPKAREQGNPPGPPPVAAARELLAAREAASPAGLTGLVRQHVFVGLADEAGEWGLLQSGTRLYLAALGPLSRDLFELQGLRRWGRCPAAALAEPLPLEGLAAAGLALEEAAGRWQVRVCYPFVAGAGPKLEWVRPAPLNLSPRRDLPPFLVRPPSQPSDGPIPELARLAAQALSMRAPVLARLGVVVDDQGRLATLPVLLNGYSPDPSRLPDLILALVRDVPWEEGEEAREVVEGVVAAVAMLFALAPLEREVERGASSGYGGDGGQSAGLEMTRGAEAMQLDGPARDAGPCHASLAPHRRLAEREWVARHVVLPAMKALLRPRPCRANDGSLLLLTSMERLYRVFERCG